MGHFDDARRERLAWNVGKKSAPSDRLTQKQVWAIRFLLIVKDWNDCNWRDRAR